MSVDSCEYISHLDDLLRTEEIKDLSLNGLQVEGKLSFATIGFAVDAHEESFIKAAASGCDCLVVHHGLFWGKPFALIGPQLRRIRILIEHNIALYAAHLPLDMHPEYGNNAEICRALGITEMIPFGTYHGVKIGFGGTLPQPADISVLVKRLSAASGSSPVALLDEGPSSCSRIAVVSGGAPELAEEAAREGYDTFITGDAQHWTAAVAREYGINIISAGHYATETFGVKALMQYTQKNFDVACTFIDVPTLL